MQYQTIYDSTNPAVYWETWGVVFGGGLILFGVLLATIVKLRRMPREDWPANYIAGAAVLTFLCLGFCGAGVANVAAYITDTRAVAQEQYRVVEGPVTKVRPLLGKGSGAFSVGRAQFVYYADDPVVSVVQGSATPYSPLNPDTFIRVAYRPLLNGRSHIVRIDVRTSGP